MDCEYGMIIKSKYADQGGCAITHGICKYVYYCHTDRTIKNSPNYIQCNRRQKNKKQ